MIRALFYLRVTSLKNWFLERVRRLRNPRYLIGGMVGVAYFWFMIFRNIMFAPAHRPGMPPNMPSELESLPLLFIFLPFGAITVIRLVAAWVTPVSRPGLVFTEPEVAFLFPAPMTRRMLVNYKLLSSQLLILVSALVIALISNRWGTLGGNAFTHAIGWWLMLSVLSLHTTGAAFTVARLTDGGVSRIRRQVTVTAIVVLLLVIMASAIWLSAPAPTPAEAANPLAFLHYLSRLTDTGVLYWVLLPFKVMLAPFLAPDWKEFFLALGPALLLLAVHYVWVLRSETSFEEASIALSEKRARLIASMRAGNYRLGQGSTKARRAPFRLASAGGRPEVAFLWKNLLSTRPYFNHRTFLVCAGLIIAGHAWLSRGGERQQIWLGVAGVVAMIMAGYTVLLGPQFARQDLRGDLANADLLKTYPLRGWQVMLGELLTPVAILTAVLWLEFLVEALAAGSLHRVPRWLTVELRLTLALCLALIAPLLCTLQLMVPNAATILFPSWAQTTRTRDRGIDVMGQRIVFVLGQVVVVVLALLPAALLGLLLWFAAHWMLGAAGSTAVATAGIAGMLAAEVTLGLVWLGGRFERFDLSGESVR